MMSKLHIAFGAAVLMTFAGCDERSFASSGSALIESGQGPVPADDSPAACGNGNPEPNTGWASGNGNPEPNTGWASGNGNPEPNTGWASKDAQDGAPAQVLNADLAAHARQVWERHNNVP